MYNKFEQFGEQSLEPIIELEALQALPHLNGDQLSEQQAAFDALQHAAEDVPFDELAQADIDLSKKEAEITDKREHQEELIAKNNALIDAAAEKIEKTVGLSPNTLARIAAMKQEYIDNLQSEIDVFDQTAPELRRRINQAYDSVLPWPIARIESVPTEVSEEISPTAAQENVVPSVLPEHFSELSSEERREVLAAAIPNLIDQLESPASEHLHNRATGFTVGDHLTRLLDMPAIEWTAEERAFVQDVTYFEKKFLMNDDPSQYRSVYLAGELQQLVKELKAVEREVLKAKSGLKADLFEIEQDAVAIANIPPKRKKGVSPLSADCDYVMPEEERALLKEVIQQTRDIDAESLIDYDMVDPTSEYGWDEIDPEAVDDYEFEDAGYNSEFWAGLQDATAQASQVIRRYMRLGGKRNTIRHKYPINVADTNFEGNDFSAVYQFVVDKFALDTLGGRRTNAEKGSQPLFMRNQERVLKAMQIMEEILPHVPRSIRRERYFGPFDSKNYINRFSAHEPISAVYAIEATAFDLLHRELRNFTRGMTLNEYSLHVSQNRHRDIQKPLDMSVVGAIRHQKRLGMMLEDLRLAILTHEEETQTVTIAPIEVD